MDSSGAVFLNVDTKIYNLLVIFYLMGYIPMSVALPLVGDSAKMRIAAPGLDVLTKATRHLIIRISNVYAKGAPHA